MNHRRSAPSVNAMRRLALAASVFIAVSLTGCSAMLAQNPSSELKPVNAVSEPDAAHLMLKGHDVVAYFTDNHHAMGLPQFQSTYQGVNFRFASAEHKALFDANPPKYLPKYGGFCADGMVYAIPWGGDADTWMIKDGSLYIFGGQGSKDAFMLDVPRNIKLADGYWSDEVQGSNSFFQRTKRLIFRVPHYKSGEELAAMVKVAKAGKP